MKLLAVTQRTLHDMRGFGSAKAAYEHALALRGVALHFPRPALGPEGLRFIIEDHPAYAEVAHLDPDGRGGLRCELQPGDVTQLSPRLWRVAGRERNAYLVADPTLTEAALIDADADDAAQRDALLRLGGSAVRWLLVTQVGDAPAAEMRAHWPDAAEVGVVQVLRLGTEATIRLVASMPGMQSFLIDEDRIVVGSPAAEPRANGADWLAPPQGFTRHIDCG